MKFLNYAEVRSATNIVPVLRITLEKDLILPPPPPPPPPTHVLVQHFLCCSYFFHQHCITEIEKLHLENMGIYFILTEKIVFFSTYI